IFEVEGSAITAPKAGFPGRSGPEGWPLPSVAERARQGLYIVPDHLNESGGSAIFDGQTVGIEDAADPGAGRGGYQLNQELIANIFKKNGGNFRLFDLGDNLGDISRAGLGLRGNPERRDELDAIGSREIAESAVGRNHLAPRG